jgi:caa(3)-type oxidase subunit IV
MSHGNHDDHKDGNSGHKHHILSNKTGLLVWLALMFGTLITVLAAQVDFGFLNFTIAMAIATVKALLVVFFFMGLLYDDVENRIIFFTSFVFVAIFIVLTSTDLFFRGDVYVKGPLANPVAGKLMFAKPWVSTPEIVAYGKEQYAAQCVSCHGAAGHGDGPAAAAYVRKPRDFTKSDAWLNGRKPSQVVGTLTKGVNQMPTFASLPIDARWALAYYVLSLGPEFPKDTDADLKLAGIDTSKPDGGLGGGAEEKSIPIDLAIERMSEK